jgi:peptidoglycan hydrolase-like protein with peptidoglycan-binding domain
MRRGTKAAFATLVVVATAGAGLAVAKSRNEADQRAVAAAAPQRLATTAVQHKDLVTYDETTATLGFTTSVNVASPVAGTITTIVASGDTIAAGSVVATIDDKPVVALIGDVPGYRDLSTTSTNGADVRELEQNLVLLGFDPDHAIVIDEHFDSATKAAVKLWEASLGLDADGLAPQSRIVYVPGNLLVDTVAATVGGAAQSGSTLLTGRQQQRRFLVSATVGQGGTVDTFASPGTVVTTGTVLFWESYVPVVAIEGDAATTPALDRDLSIGVSDGADVKLLEEMLAAGGFDPSKAMTIDDHFDAATAYAVVLWRQSLGLAPSAGAVVVPAGSFVVVPSGLFGGDQLVPNGTQLPANAVVMTLTTAARDVTTTAPIGDATFAVGATIDVEFPDGTVQPGKVVSVGNVATDASNVPGATPSVTITIHVDNIPASVDSFVQIPVTLRVVSDSVPGAYVVPVSALVALAEGGYALQAVDGAKAGTTSVDATVPTHLIGVTPGLFTDGFVSVTGSGLAEGMIVVVPS